MFKPQANAKGPPPPIGTPTGGRARGSYQRAGVWQIRACRRPKETRVRPAGPSGPRRPSRRLLQFDGRALRFELLLDFFGFLLGHAFLHGAGRAFHQVLGLLQAQAGDRPDLFDDLDLLLTAALQDDGELGLLFSRRRRDRDAELLLERLDELRQFKHRHVPDGFEDVALAQTRLRRHSRVSHPIYEAAPAEAARLVRSASRAPTTFISKPFNAPTKPASGACSVPPTWASSSVRDGRLASRFTCSGVTALPSTSPALMAGFSNSLAKSASTFAAPTGSAPASTRPVGPTRCGSSPGTWAAPKARRASVFLTTTNSVPACRRRRRSCVIFATSRPVKSVTYTVLERRSRVASAVTSSCFCALVRIMRTPSDPAARRGPSCSRPSPTECSGPWPPAAWPARSPP